MIIDRAHGLRVASSGIDRQGVFATRGFRRGETVLILDDSRVVDDEHPLDVRAGELAHHCDYLAGGRVVLMPSPERYINSSCQPNTTVITRDRVRHVVALTAIGPGDEVTCDYLINCHDPPAEEQRRLHWLLDDWFAVEHADRLRALDQEVGT